MIYLACPYSHPNKTVQYDRYMACIRACVALMQRGHHVLSPIVHNHPISITAELPGGWQFWKKYDLEMLDTCNAMFVLKEIGWKTSEGVQAEIAWAKAKNIPICYVDPERGYSINNVED